MLDVIENDVKFIELENKYINWVCEVRLWHIKTNTRKSR